MHRICIRLIFVVLATFWPVAVAAEFDTKSVRAGLSKSYAGTFQWYAGGAVQNVTVTVREVRERSDGQVIVIGRGKYDTSGEIISADVKWQIDPTSLRIEMRDSNPDAENFEADGSYIGLISADFKTILSIWTTKSSGEQGTLMLEAQ